MVFYRSPGRKIICAQFLLIVFLFTACAQTGPFASAAEVKTAPALRYVYNFEIKTKAVGFSLLLNGMGIASFDGAGDYTASIPVNDWALPGENELLIQFILPPLPSGKQAAPQNTGSFCDFFLKQQIFNAGGGLNEESVIYSYTWRAEGKDKNTGFGPVSEVIVPAEDVKGRFTLNKFPRVMISQAERLDNRSLTKEDQEEISRIATMLQGAFSAKDLSAVDGLLKTRYRDLASARFLSAADFEAENSAFYASLVGNQGFAPRPPNGRYVFLSTMNGRLVKVTQGSVAFPLPALILEYRDDKGRRIRYDIDLYFAKINGVWLIVR